MPGLANRREFLQTAGAVVAGMCVPSSSLLASTTPPAGKVAFAKCASYGAEAHQTLSTLFDQLGGLDRLVRGKTVVVKLNMTGGIGSRLNGMPLGMTHWVNPDIIASTVHLLGQAGARRIRLVESTASPANSLPEFMTQAGWNPKDFTSAARNVEFEDTNYAGPGGKYVRMRVPGGGLLFSAYELNHSYHDCDVYVSLAKLKEHATAGVTLSMKNSFGITPATVYGMGAGVDAPSKVAKGARVNILHEGNRQPSKDALPELNPHSPRDPGYRVPRVVADLAGARPIHLAVIDGVYTAAGGEGPWIPTCRPVHAGLLIAGTNCVSTDAVSTALMGFDPMATRGTAPFEHCASTLELAEGKGLGTRDLRRIEVIGMSVSKAKIDFRNA